MRQPLERARRLRLVCPFMTHRTKMITGGKDVIGKARRAIVETGPARA